MILSEKSMCGAPWWIHDVLSTSTAAIQIQRKHNSCHANEGVGGGKAYTTKNKGMRNRQIGERRGEHTHTHTHTHTQKSCTSMHEALDRVEADAAAAFHNHVWGAVFEALRHLADGIRLKVVQHHHIRPSSYRARS